MSEAMKTQVIPRNVETFFLNILVVGAIEMFIISAAFFFGLALMFGNVTDYV